MQSYNSKDVITGNKTVVALGNFDGLHKAHMQVIERARDYAVKNGYESGVMLFDNVKDTAGQIMTNDEKKHFLSSIDFVYIQQFDEAFKSMSCDEFAVFLRERLNAAAVSVGFNYRFAKGASGDVKKLTELGEKYGFCVLISNEYKIGDYTVSSTKIRELIASGNVKEANFMLGRDFYVSGTVEGGYKIGRTMGYPTVNLKYDKVRLIPAKGVYAGFVEAQSRLYKCVVNVGTRPTFSGDSLTIEAYLLNFEGDLYNQEIKIYFSEFLRKERKFDDINELTEQISIDVKNADKALKGDK